MAAQHGRRAAPPSRSGAGARRDREPAAPARGPRGDDLAAQRERLRAIIEPVVRGVGFDLDELKISRMGRTHVVRVVVDGEEGISLDDVAEVSRAASAALDEAELTGGAFTVESYQLEVSSPGVDRPLTLPRHWRRNVGRLVKVKAGERMLTGRVTAVGDETIRLDVNGKPVEVPLAELGPGHVQIEFARLAELAEEDFGEEFAQDADEDDVDEDEDGKGRDEA